MTGDLVCHLRVNPRNDESCILVLERQISKK